MILSKFDLTGRVAIVTGGGQGIGKAIATALAEAGSDIVVVDKEARVGEPAAAELSGLGRRAIFVPADVRQREQVIAAVQRVQAEFGRVDILVNNAGGNFRAAALDISDNGWDAILRLDLKAPFVFSGVVAKVMLEQQKGCIVNIASASGQFASPGMAHYGAAKAALINLTQTLAVEWAPYIRVNAIAPGAIATPGTVATWGDPERRAAVERSVPMARYGRPEDIAAAALFLASDAADYITGHTLDVNGGPQVPSYLTRYTSPAARGEAG